MTTDKNGLTLENQLMSVHTRKNGLFLVVLNLHKETQVKFTMARTTVDKRDV